MNEALINAMLATSYEAGGRGPTSYDCWGMVLHVCEQMGWPVPRDPLLWAEQSPKEQLRIFREQVRGEEWKLCSATDGAVAFMGKFDAARHAGIVINGGVLHTIEPREGITAGGPSWTSLIELQGRWEFAKWVG